MIITWNARGAAGTDFGIAVKEINKRFSPTILVLVETRCSGENAQRVIKRLGYANQIIVEAQGMSGGIWLLWNDPKILVQTLHKHKQFLHCEIEGLTHFKWAFTAVYASPRETERKDLWLELEAISRQIRLPWLLAGDFNDIKCQGEQRGGIEPKPQKCLRFRNNIDKCQLIDLGAEGPKFTWRGPIVKHACRLYKRLDRALCNGDWKAKFGDAKVIIGPRLQSDHHPVIVKLVPPQARTGERPFRFEAAWLTHGKFQDFVKDKCDRQGVAWHALTKLEAELLDWNVSTFGHIAKRKLELLRRIGGIQRSLQGRNDNNFLEELESKLQHELREILLQEEILWYQKSRSKWLNDRDRNTKFYHLKTKVNRSRHRVTMLMNEQNQWVEGKHECGTLINAFFQDLFHEEDDDRPWFATKHSWPTVTGEDWEVLQRPLTNDEIRRAIFSIGSFKAPGEDGFQAIFFQKCWDTIGPSVCDSVKILWNSPHRLEEVNTTLVTLIPKVDCPERVHQFRPISLCNVLYKCLSKIIVQRLKNKLTYLVSPYQVSFVPGRNIHDNVIIVNEMVHSMRRKKGKKGFMAIKIDLAKAYDRMSWAYMRKVLDDLQCPAELSERIMLCVTTTSTKILWHGEKLEPFKPSRGLRQGDPISPYLFVLGMDKLTHLILDSVSERKWRGMRAGRRGPFITHMMFADDLVLFAEVDQANINTVLSCLQVFGEMSGQTVSHDKSVIYFSPNVDVKTRRDICSRSKFKQVDDLGRYLGAEISFPRHGKTSTGA